MGMFDTVRSSYPLLGPELDLELQTKDLECAMLTYWLDPAGQLYEINACCAFDGVVVPKDERQWPWQTVRWEPNGQHGVVRPVFTTALMHVVSPLYRGPWEKRPEACVYLRDGQVVERVEGVSGA